MSTTISPQASAGITPLLHQIQSYWQKLQTLETLAPGHGYDEIGHGICNLVLSPHYTVEQKSACIAALENDAPQILHDIQNASIRSEMALESTLMEAASQHLQPPKDCDSAADFNQKTRARKKALDELLADHPFSWAEPRTHDECWLLENATATSKPGPGKQVIYWGRSMLPFSALHMHYLTQAQIIWLDPETASANKGAAFVRKLADNNYLDSYEAIQIHHFASQDRFDRYFDIQKTAGFIILDSELITESGLKAIDELGIDKVIATDTNSLAKLMYPPADTGILSKQRKHSASVYPHHCDLAGTTGQADVKRSESPYQFTTLHCFTQIS